ncbi:LOW QUALITY PROTEIN: coronin-1C-A-like [Drosophila obscura]|uniref:LOW QUALITY PROTEIN: coronin-1C-A-like n=1 Tax=Drosophila obscura TaxID=7282 RepID=UPI001BB10F89|nr:LOW QUALITY PROTEIN: coronin-1C-A-like [Drosophila obscura]
MSSWVGMKHHSKFRQLQAQTLSRESCYENLRFSRDSTSCAVNPKFVAIIVESVGGGAFIVIPRCNVGPIPMDYPTVNGHRGWVLDIAWSPHNDHVIASGSNDGVARVWAIPVGGLTAPLSTAIVDLAFHKGRVGLVLWHPSALNVLVTAGSDNQLAIWNVGTGQLLSHLDAHPDIVYSACFNWNGSMLATTCRDTRLRVFEPRTGELLGSAVCHEGGRPTRVIFLRQGLLFTTGYSRTMERQYSLRSLEQLHQPLAMVNLDAQIGLLFPIYDPDTNLIYLCGRGDHQIPQVTDKAPFVHFINSFVSKEPLRGACLMPKRGCNIHNWEMAKIYRLNNKGVCEIISLTMPRQTDLCPDDLPDDLIPDTQACIAAITAVAWMSGQNADPKMYSFKAIYGIWKRSLMGDHKANILNEQQTICTVCGPDQQQDAGQDKPPAADETLTDKLLLALQQMMQLNKKLVYSLGRQSVVASMQEICIRSLQDRVDAIEALLCPGTTFDHDAKQHAQADTEQQLAAALPLSSNSQGFVTLLMDSLIASLGGSQNAAPDSSSSSEEAAANDSGAAPTQ